MRVNGVAGRSSRLARSTRDQRDHADVDQQINKDGISAGSVKVYAILNSNEQDFKQMTHLPPRISWRQVACEIEDFLVECVTFIYLSGFQGQ